MCIGELLSFFKLLLLVAVENFLLGYWSTDHRPMLFIHDYLICFLRGGIAPSGKKFQAAYLAGERYTTEPNACSTSRVCGNQDNVLDLPVGVDDAEHFVCANGD